MAADPANACTVRQSPNDPDRWYFDFDQAAPGGRGGASVRLDLNRRAASIDGIRSNALLPRRSTGALAAAGLRLAGMPQPAVLEAYNVEKTTSAALAAGSDGPGTLLGNFLEDAVAALGGSIQRWEPVPDGTAYHLRVQVSYP